MILDSRQFFVALSLVLTVTGVAESAGTDLSGHDTWLKLVHYEAERKEATGFLSATLSDSFFLAKDGRTDPASELRATLTEMSAPLRGNANEHAQCRFPARFIWLQRQSALSDVDQISCPDFEEWIFGEATESLSIVFVTGYLGNPASYYGHTLLKFNSAEGRNKSDLLDVTVNYGAIIPPGTGPINYIYNGVTGGFQAGFSHVEYYFHDYNYGELELRDLWEYELELTDDEVRFVVAHAWEVLGREFVYYFFRKNCAYRMAELLEIVDGVDIIPPRRGWTIPQAVIRQAAELEHHGKLLLKKPKRYASRQSEFYAKFRDLSRAERRVLRAIVRKFDEQSVPKLLETLSVEEQQRVIDTLLDYYQYRMPNDEPSDSELSAQYRALLALRFGLPTAVQLHSEPPRHSPEEDRPPGYFSLGYVHNDAHGNGTVFRIRPAYYDALDSSVSHVLNSELSMADVTLQWIDGKLLLRQASLFRVESVNGAVSRLPGDNGRSWILGLGLTEQSNGCDNCLVARFEGDIGRSMPVGDWSTAGLYIGGAVQDDRNGNGNLFTRLSAYWNVAVGERLRLRTRYESRYHLDGRLEFEDVISVDARFELSRRWDARLRLLKNVDSDVSLSFGYYW